MYDRERGKLGTLWDDGCGLDGRNPALPGPGVHAAPMSLSRAHICTSRSAKRGMGEGHRVTVALGGRSARVAGGVNVYGTGRGQGGGGKRGAVRHFSDQSRRRLREVFTQIDQRSVVNTFFGTLTCAAVAPEVFKRRVRAYFARLERGLPGRWAVVWRMELHKSGAPHLHFMMYWRERSPDIWGMRAVSDAAWTGICGTGEGGGSSQVEYVRGDGKAKGYMCKAEGYVSKRGDQSEHENVGRWWGVLRGKYLPVALAMVHVTEDQAKRVGRILRKFCAKRSRVSVLWDGLGKQIHRGARGDWLADFNARKSLRARGFKCRLLASRFLYRDVVEVWGRVEETGESYCIGPEVVTQHVRHFPVAAEPVRRLLAHVLGVDLITAAESSSREPSSPDVKQG